MNATEGLMRIAIVVRWVGYALSAGVIVFSVAVNIRDKWEFFAVLATVAAAALVAGIGWTLSWIIEGFAKPKT